MAATDSGKERGSEIEKAKTRCQSSVPPHLPLDPKDSPPCTVHQGSCSEAPQGAALGNTDIITG